MDITRELNGTKLTFTLSRNELERAHHEFEVLAHTDHGDLLPILRKNAASSNLAAALLISARLPDQKDFYLAVHSAWRKKCLSLPMGMLPNIEENPFESLVLSSASECVDSFPEKAVPKQALTVDSLMFEMKLETFTKKMYDMRTEFSLMYLADKEDIEAMARIAALLDMLECTGEKNPVDICKQAYSIFC